MVPVVKGKVGYIDASCKQFGASGVTMYIHNLKGFFRVVWNFPDMCWSTIDHTQTLYHSSQDLEAVPGCDVHR